MPVLAHSSGHRLIRARSADPDVLQFLQRSPQRLCVHSAFERVINIDAGNGRLVTLANRDSDDAPDTVVVDLDAWAAHDFMTGTEVNLSGGRILLGGEWVVALDHAVPWDGRLPAYVEDDATLRANLPVAQDHLARHGKGIAPGRCSGAVPTGFDLAMAEAFQRGVRGLCQALARNDEPRALDEIERLVGLGIGLTPSGDDFLVGLLAALNVPGSPRHAWRRIGARVTDCAFRQTHLISAAALRHAANGKVRASLVDLCHALMHDGPSRMLQALARVMRIGSSSGTEIALGVLAGFRLHAGLEEACGMPSPQPQIAGESHG